MGARISSRHVARARFPRAWWGYRPREVKLLLRQMERALERVELAQIPRLTAADVDDAQFGMRLIGYRPGSVDDLLDRVAARLVEAGSVRVEVPRSEAAMLTATRTHRVRFRRRRQGYRVEEVRAFLRRVADELDRLESGEATAGLSAEEVDLTTFQVGFRGYDEYQVDTFLEQVAATLSAWRRRRPKGPPVA